LVPTEYADRMIAALQLPEIRQVVIARCGHIPQQECPIRFSQELAGILALQRSPRPAAPVKDAAVKEK
jgi:pimeloyl-ACP methyl ester carboxylesterase